MFCAKLCSDGEGGHLLVPNTSCHKGSSPLAAPSLDVIVGTSGQKYLPMTCFEHEGWFDSNSIHQVLRWIDIASWI